MSKIKLNPLVDLGLANDPNYDANQAKEVEVEVPVNDVITTTPVTSIDSPVIEPAKPIDQTSSPFQGIGDITKFTQPTPQTPSQNVQIPPQVKVTGETNSSGKTANILFLLSITLFIISIGALFFFALKYFKVL